MTMQNKAHSLTSIFGMNWNPASATFTATLMLLSLIPLLLSLIITTQPAQAQTYTVIHSFTGGRDGISPESGLTRDVAGNFYGTTFGSRSSAGRGTVYKLRDYSSIGWVLNGLYTFKGGSDGANPYGRVAFAQDGTLYGTTEFGGGIGCGEVACGTVFQLKPPARIPNSAQDPWNETVIYRFTGGSDGAYPQGDLTFDASGNIYGTAQNGGDNSSGVAYELVRSGAGWGLTVLYAFYQYTGDGVLPTGGVVFDRSGNLYGVTQAGGASDRFGTVYKLSPSGGGWTEQILYSFTGGNDGADPIGGLIIDASGNLYGTTTLRGSGYGGTVFELTPANGGWTFNVLYGFYSQDDGGGGPEDKLAMDAAGNLYGTTMYGGAYGLGNVFKLTPSNGGWIYTSLYDFCSEGYPACRDGAWPVSNVVFDANGNLYGTTSLSGAYGYGTVWEITQ